MATDVADWTQAVNVTGGSVSISGTANVSIVGTPAVTISGTATVQISGTPSVTIASGTVNIGGTPIVNVQQANGITVVGPNLLLGALAGPITTGWSGENGTVAYQAVGPVRVTSLAAGGFNLVKTLPPGVAVVPGQTIQVTAQVKALDNNDTAAVGARFLDATGASTGNHAGTFPSTPVGTWTALTDSFVVPAGVYSLQPFVQIPGSTLGDRYDVSDYETRVVGAFPINAQQGALPTNMPQVDLGQISSPANGEGVTTLALPAGTQAVAIRLDSSLYAKYGHVIVRGSKNLPNTKTNYFTAYTFNQEVFAFPVLSTFDSSIEVAVQNSDNVTVVTVEVVALLQSVPEFLQLFPQPQLEPNQTPLGFAAIGFAGQSAKWIITPTANVRVSLFNLTVTRRQGTTDGTLFYVGQGSSLPVATPTTWLIKAEAAAALMPWSNLPFAGAQLARGNGLWVWNDDLAAGTLSLASTLQYSLS